MKHTVLLVDGNWLVRRGLRAVFDEQADFTVAAEAASADEALYQAGLVHPDIALVDLQLPGGGIPLVHALKGQYPSTRVVVLGEGDLPEVVREALRAGCDGYLLRSGLAHDLIDAMRRVRRGEVHLDPETSRRLVLAELRRDDRDPNMPLQRLTERELEVFRLIGSGYTNRAAAERIRLSPKTVEKHRASVMQKLSLRNAVDLRLLALRLGVSREAEAGFVDALR